MSENLRQIIKEHHAFYEVLPHYIVLEDRSHGATTTTRRIQTGFDVDIFCATTNHKLATSAEYTQGYEALRQLAAAIPDHSGDACSIEVIPYPSTVVLDTRNHFEPEALFRIRVSNCWGLDKSDAPPKQMVLTEIENQLHNLGVARR